MWCCQVPATARILHCLAPLIGESRQVWQLWRHLIDSNYVDTLNASHRTASCILNFSILLFLSFFFFAIRLHRNSIKKDAWRPSQLIDVNLLSLLYLRHKTGEKVRLFLSVIIGWSVWSDLHWLAPHHRRLVGLKFTWWIGQSCLSGLLSDLIPPHPDRVSFLSLRLEELTHLLLWLNLWWRYIS